MKRIRGEVIMVCVAAVMAVAWAGCSRSNSARIVRLDRFVAEGLTDSILAPDVRPGAEAFCRLLGNGNEIVTDSLIIQGANNDRERTALFQRDIDSRLGSLDAVEQQLGAFRDNAATLLPEVNFPAHIYGIATPYLQSVMTIDSVMLIGLNHYLGEDYPGYAAFGSESAKLKVKQRMAVDIAETLIRRDYPFQLNDSTTLLQRMLYDGTLTAAIAATLPDASLSDILGIDPANLRELQHNERQIRNQLIERGLLFSTDDRIAAQLFMPAPESTPLGHGYPGRAVRYIAYRMVESYINRNSESNDISPLLSPAFYNGEQTLARSGYNP